MQSYKDKVNYHTQSAVFETFSWQNRFFIIPLHTLTHERLAIQVDSLAQLVEHFTFNEGVSGSNPERVTTVRGKALRNNKVFPLVILTPLSRTN